MYYVVEGVIQDTPCLYKLGHAAEKSLEQENSSLGSYQFRHSRRYIGLCLRNPSHAGNFAPLHLHLQSVYMKQWRATQSTHNSRCMQIENMLRRCKRAWVDLEKALIARGFRNFRVHVQAIIAHKAASKTDKIDAHLMSKMDTTGSLQSNFCKTPPLNCTDSSALAV